MIYREAGQFKTTYASDQAIFPIVQDRWLVLALLAAACVIPPALASEYWLQAVLIPFLIYSMAALGLNLLTGYAGQISLGTGGFMAVGAYSAFKLTTAFPDLNILVVFVLAGLAAAGVGLLFGIPSLRIKGFYLAVATLAAQFFLIWLFNKVPWFVNYASSGTITAPPRTMLGIMVTGPQATAEVRYVVALALVVIFALAAKNLVRGRIGRSWMAIRDRDIAAEIIGVRPLRTKLLAFGISSFYIGVAGAELVFLFLGSAETLAFDINQSFLVLFMIIIGGLGSILGSFLGAAFIMLMPIFLTNAPRLVGLSLDVALQKHLELMIFGGLIIVFLIVEPHGLARLWQIAKEKLRLWPFPTNQHGGSAMRATVLVSVLLAAATALGPLAAVAPAQQGSMFVPLLVYRTGPYAPNGIPSANGFNDYFNLLNERDGGVNGVKIAFEECETQYDTKQGVECYERLKSKHPVLVNPFSTGITYQLIPKASVDKVVIHSAGYGMTASADGRWFPWVFNVPMTYWSQASAFVKYMGAQEGGMDKLKGKKLVHVYHNSPYGREANPTLETLSRQLGFELTLLPVDHPGQEQKATWLQVRRINPDWIYVSGWGVMNQVAIKEAASIGYKMDRMVGNWWTGTESDVVPAGAGAQGYKSMTFHAPGAKFKVHEDIFKFVYDRGKGAARREAVGEVLYNRTIINAMLDVEAMRTAMAKFGNKPLTAEQVRWGMENLNITEQRLEQLGMKGMMRPLRVTCEDHEGDGQALVQQWDGKQWTIVSDWIEPMREVVRPKIEAAAVEEGKKLGYTMRDCAKEQ